MFPSVMVNHDMHVDMEHMVQHIDQTWHVNQAWEKEGKDRDYELYGQQQQNIGAAQHGAFHQGDTWQLGTHGGYVTRLVSMISFFQECFCAVKVA